MKTKQKSNSPRRLRRSEDLGVLLCIWRVAVLLSIVYTHIWQIIVSVWVSHCCCVCVCCVCILYTDSS